MDPGTRGPLVDESLCTSRPDVFAAGNLIHPVDTAAVAALDGRHVAARVRAQLAGARPSGPALRLRAEAPLAWVAPGLFRPAGLPPPRDRLLLLSGELVRRPEVIVWQAGERIGRHRLHSAASPGRVIGVPASVLAAADPRGGELTIGLR
jgi:hypothetical protein